MPVSLQRGQTPECARRDHEGEEHRIQNAEAGSLMMLEYTESGPTDSLRTDILMWVELGMGEIFCAAGEPNSLS